MSLCAIFQAPCPVIWMQVTRLAAGGALWLKYIFILHSSQMVLHLTLQLLCVALISLTRLSRHTKHLHTALSRGSAILFYQPLFHLFVHEFVHNRSLRLINMCGFLNASLWFWCGYSSVSPLFGKMPSEGHRCSFELKTLTDERTKVRNGWRKEGKEVRRQEIIVMILLLNFIDPIPQ